MMRAISCSTKSEVPMKKNPVFKNVAVVEEDHELLRLLAEKEQRSMARQLSVMIRRATKDLEKEDGR